MENNMTDQPTSAMGIEYKTSSCETITVLLAKSSNRYRIQANTLTALSLATEQLLFRLYKHYSNVDNFRLSLGTTLPANEIVPYIVKHFSNRQEVIFLEVRISFINIYS